MSKILIFAFGYRDNLSHIKAFKLLQKMRTSQCITFVGGVNKRTFDNLQNKVMSKKPQFIIGLGSYRKDSKNIKVETRYQNKYGVSSIETRGSDNLYSNWKISESVGAKLAVHAGNGPCNMISYQIMSFIQMGKLSAKYTFLHVPANADVTKVLTVIEQILKLIKS